MTKPSRISGYTKKIDYTSERCNGYMKFQRFLEIHWLQEENYQRLTEIHGYTEKTVTSNLQRYNGYM